MAFVLYMSKNRAKDIALLLVPNNFIVMAMRKFLDCCIWCLKTNLNSTLNFRAIGVYIKIKYEI